MLDQPTKPATSVVIDDNPEHEGPWLARLARFSGRHRRAVLIIWLVTTLAAAPLALTLTHSLSGAGWEAQGSTAQHVRDELRRDFPQANAEAAVVVYHQATPDRRQPGGPAHPRGFVAGCTWRHDRGEPPDAPRRAPV